MDERAAPALTRVPVEIDGRTSSSTICHVYGCTSPLYLARFCEKHFFERNKNSCIEDLAISALHFGMLGGQPLADVDLRNDLAKLSEEWQIVCLVLNFRRQYCGLTPSEAPAAQKWCVALAVEVIKAQEALDNGETLPASYKNARDVMREGFRESSTNRSVKKTLPK